jgi:hypothetical protein
LNSYTWQETLAAERLGNEVLDALFGNEYIIVHATRAHQSQKIDRFHIHKKDGREIFRVDYKTDYRAGSTGNLALEDVSVRKNGRVVAQGWVHTSRSDLVVFYVPQHDTAYVLEILALRENWPHIRAGHRPLQTSTKSNSGDYITEFFAVPITWLRNNRLFKKELLAVGAQLRLSLKSGR